jgi:hypothetical protein
MVPLAAPYKSVFFKYINYYLWNIVTVFYSGIFAGAFAGPFPIVGVGGVDILEKGNEFSSKTT